MITTPHERSHLTNWTFNYLDLTHFWIRDPRVTSLPSQFGQFGHRANFDPSRSASLSPYQPLLWVIGSLLGLLVRNRPPSPDLGYLSVIPSTLTRSDQIRSVIGIQTCWRGLLSGCHGQSDICVTLEPFSQTHRSIRSQANCLESLDRIRSLKIT